MKYSTESKRILISVDELISISRRGVSATVPVNEDEPSTASASARMRQTVIGSTLPTVIDYDFDAFGYAFTLRGALDAQAKGSITILREAEISPSKPRRDELEAARGCAFILGYMQAMKLGINSVSLKMVFFNEKSGEYAEKIEEVDLPTLERFFSRCTVTLAKYARPEIERVTVRLPSMKSVRFPFDTVRDGQSELVRATYRTLARGSSLYACAPTGTGKTVSVLFPAIRLVGEGKHDKVFYLTPKSTAAEVAKSCIELLAGEGAVIRAVVLSSKERCCKRGLVCRQKISLCPLSDGSRLADAALDLYDRAITVVTLPDILDVAALHSVCPYELELTYSELCDCVICDINYLFDPRVYIRRYFDRGGRYSFLIDEAHNLKERASEMYSCELSLPVLSEKLSSPLIPQRSDLGMNGERIVTELKEPLLDFIKDDIHRGRDGEMLGAAHSSELPGGIYSPVDELLLYLDRALKSAYSQKDEDALARIELIRDLFYEIRRLAACVASFDEAYRMFVFYKNGDITLKLYAIDTGAIIKSLLAKGHGAVFFSATLSPLEYYKSVLGGDGSSEVLEVRSPFAPESLSVSIVDKISTRYSERARTLPAVSRAIAATVSAKRGNYMVFAPSFEYLEGLARDFCEKYPKIKVLEQRREMSAREKADFLAEFEKDSDSYLIGFCVMGGIYSEGIDLVGKRLIGAIVVGIGIPSLSYEREAMAEYYEEKYEAGKQYAYIYPGMNRVFQAAGRVIRHENDRGVIVLIDGRFADPIYKKSIPALWRGMEYVGDAKELNERVKEFWREVDKESAKK